MRSSAQFLTGMILLCGLTVVASFWRPSAPEPAEVEEPEEESTFQYAADEGSPWNSKLSEENLLLERASLSRQMNRLARMERDQVTARIIENPFSADRPQARHGEAGVEEMTFAALERIRSMADREGLPMADLSLAWLLTRPAVSSVIVGGRNPDQVKRNVKAMEETLSPELVAELSRATDDLKTALGTNADLWQGSPSRIQ